MGTWRRRDGEGEPCHPRTGRARGFEVQADIWADDMIRAHTTGIAAGTAEAHLTDTLGARRRGDPVERFRAEAVGVPAAEENQEEEP